MYILTIVTANSPTHKKFQIRTQGEDIWGEKAVSKLLPNVAANRKPDSTFPGLLHARREPVQRSKRVLECCPGPEVPH